MGIKPLSIDEYTVNRDGTIINNRWNKPLKPQPNSKGYLRVQLAHKFYFVHRLVAEKFVPNPENKPQVNHKDGNKHNNCADNLEWVTNQENRDHAVSHGLHVHGEACPWAKLSQSDVDFIRSNPQLPSKFIASIFNINPTQVRNILRHDSWK